MILQAALATVACLTPAAPHEPPCNPHLADSGWGSSHRASYASGASALPGPRPGDEVTRQHVRLPGSVSQVPISITFSSPYPDGSRAAWMSVVSSPDVQGVHKVDARTGAVIDSITTAPSSAEATITGAYNLLDRDDHLFVGRERSLDVFGDEQPGERDSQIIKVAALTVPDEALCGPDDKLVGITMTYDGYVAYASERGAVGVVPRELERFDADHLRHVQLGKDCNDEIVSNSISADEDGGIYVVTSKAMHRVQWDGRRLRKRWRAEYETGLGGGVRLGDGSGSTPDVMGTSRDRDRFVVITDGQELMHLVLMWRGRVPAGEKRIACEVPVTFGDPDATSSSSEQSVLTSGYSSYVVNNKLKNEAAFADLPPAQRQIAAALAGQDPLNAPYGVERIDWNPRTRACRSVWANSDISIPNAIPTLSLDAGLMYGQGQRNGVWGLEGLDLATGESSLYVQASALPDSNSIYAATEIGPEGDVWQGTGGGIDIYRGPERTGPPLRCFDLDPPVLVRARLRGRLLTGRARDVACGEPGKVFVRAGGRRVPVRGGRFRVRLGRVPRKVTVRAVDRAGQRSRTRVLKPARRSSARRPTAT